jgi:hypothetical protein
MARLSNAGRCDAGFAGESIDADQVTSRCLLRPLLLLSLLSIIVIIIVSVVRIVVMFY